jgi:hypothetical protein
VDRHNNPLALQGYPDVVIALSMAENRTSNVAQSVADRLAEVLHAAT